MMGSSHPAPSSERFKAATAQIAILVENRPEVQDHALCGLRELLACLEIRRNGAPDVISGDRRKLQERIKGFDERLSAPYHYFKQRGWLDLMFPEMVAIGEVLSVHYKIHLDREARRTRPVFFKWLDDSWPIFGDKLDGLEVIHANDEAAAQK
jgi:hypothetical protein